MWIMLIKKLGTNPSPPKLSIFWSMPWPDDKYAIDQVLQWLRETHGPLRAMRLTGLNNDRDFWRAWLIAQGLPAQFLRTEKNDF